MMLPVELASDLKMSNSDSEFCAKFNLVVIQRKATEIEEHSLFAML